MSDPDRNEILRTALAAGAASFARSLPNTDIGGPGASPVMRELALVQRLIDAAGERLTSALADPGEVDPEIPAALKDIAARALAVAIQAETAPQLG